MVGYFWRGYVRSVYVACVPEIRLMDAGSIAITIIGIIGLLGILFCAYKYWMFR